MYIKREEAIMAVTRAKLPDFTPEGVPIANGKRSVTDCVRRLKEIPAADVRPVVCCKDCVHFIRGELLGDMVCDYHYRHHYHAEPNEFCSHAEKREES